MAMAWVLTACAVTPADDRPESDSDSELESAREPEGRDAAASSPACGGLGPFDPVPLTPESLECARDDDCVIREASCCPTCDARNIIAIRVGAERFWQCCLPLPVCTTSCEPYEPGRYPRCIEGRCTLVER
jgi:hypothetical protein